MKCHGQMVKNNLMIKTTKNIHFNLCHHHHGFILQNKSKLVTYVIAAGLTYGAGEHIFHYLFKVRLFSGRQYFTAKRLF